MSHAAAQGDGTVTSHEPDLHRRAPGAARGAVHQVPDQAGLPAAGALDGPGGARLDLGAGDGRGRASVLGLTPAYVKGVVTFYTMYHTHPVGRHFIQVCTTSPCGLCGAEETLQAILRESGCGELGATSADGRFTAIEVECLGACGFATPILVDDDFIEGVTPERVPGILAAYK